LNEHYSEWHSLLDVRQGGATEPLGGMGETAGGAGVTVGGLGGSHGAPDVLHGTASDAHGVRGPANGSLKLRTETTSRRSAEGGEAVGTWEGQ